MISVSGSSGVTGMMFSALAPSGDQLTKHGRLAQALEQLAEELAGDEHRAEHEEQPHED
jgi:hypothetical protein